MEKGAESRYDAYIFHFVWIFFFVACALLGVLQHWLTPVHELGHLLMAKARGYTVTDFGGNYIRWQPNPLDPIVLAAGPLFSFVVGLAIALIGLWRFCWALKSHGPRWHFIWIYMLLVFGVNFAADGIYNLVPDAQHPEKDGTKIFGQRIGGRQNK